MRHPIWETPSMLCKWYDHEMQYLLVVADLGEIVATAECNEKGKAYNVNLAGPRWHYKTALEHDGWSLIHRDDMPEGAGL